MHGVGDGPELGVYGVYQPREKLMNTKKPAYRKVLAFFGSKGEKPMDSNRDRTRHIRSHFGPARAWGIFVLITLFVNPGWAQPFTPLALHDATSKELMARIDDHFAAPDDAAKTDPWVSQVRLKQAAQFKRMVRAQAFVKNDSLQAYVEGYFDRIARSNDVGDGSRLVLILNSPERNAASYGSGVFVVTAGLLANLNDPSQLAFIFAHELAHDRLQHVQQNLAALSGERETRNRAAFARILWSDSSPEAIDAFRTAIYANAATSRRCESQADSMALELIQRAGFDNRASISALKALVTDKPGNGGVAMFASLDFNDYPFKDRWLNERLTVYNRKPASTYLMSFDSVRTHPELESRISVLSTHLKTDADLSFKPRPSAELRRAMEFATMMAFQTADAAYAASQYDIALHQILRLLQDRPGDPYLVTRAATIMLDLYHAKNERDGSLLATVTTGMTEEEIMVNTVLHNMSREELAEMAYHFVNSKENFDRSKRSHYYLLWQACQVTERHSVREKVSAAYRQRFGTSIESFGLQ